MRWEPLSPFDALVSTDNLEHFRESDRAFERMVAMLAPGGKLRSLQRSLPKAHEPTKKAIPTMASATRLVVRPGRF